MSPAPRSLVTLSELAWRTLVVAAAVALLAYVLWHLRLVVLPVFLALLLATVLVPPARALRRRGVPALVATFVVFLGAAGVFAGLGLLVVPPFVDELDRLADSVRAGADEVADFVASGAFGLSQGEVQDAIDRAEEQLRGSAGSLASGVVTGALVVVEIIAGLLLTLVILFFFVKDGERMWGWVVRLFPAVRRDTVRDVGESSWRIFEAYVRGIAVVATVDAVLIAVALAIIGVPLVFPLAVLTFFGAFFPIIGAFTAGLAAVLVALVAEGVVAALIVVAVITLIQQLEGDLLYPVVVGRTVELHPVAILLAVTTGAVVAGIVGAFVAVPLAAVLAAGVPIVRARAGPSEGAAVSSRPARVEARTGP